MTNKWLRRLDRGAAADANLFCFPHAGGGAAAYRLWPRGLPPQVAVWGVQLPGRADRLRETPIANLPALVEAVVAALQPHLDRPFALFGHSMGAVLAFETASALAQSGARLPDHIIVSGRRPPHLPGTEPDLHRLDDGQFVAEIDRRYGGIPAELRHDREVLALLLPALRADVAALETHRPARAAPLDVPITACGGEQDRLAPRAHIAAWSDLTTAAFRMRLFAGGHFYIDPQRDAFLAHLAATLAPMLRSGQPDAVLPAGAQSAEAAA